MLRPLDLLRRLSSGVRPDGTARAERQPIPIEHLPFEALLERSRVGGVESIRPILVDPELAIELTNDDRELLGVATDAAEGKGAQRLLVIIQGRGLGVDVSDRRVESAGEVLEGRVLDRFDAVVLAPEVGARQLRERLADPEAHARRPFDPAALLGGPAPNASVRALAAQRDSIPMITPGPHTVPGGAR